MRMYKVTLRCTTTNQTEIITIGAESTFEAHHKALDAVHEKHGDSENWYVKTSSRLNPCESASKH